MVGDSVCDCKYDHLRIVSIDEEFMVALPPWADWIKDYIPRGVYDTLNKAFGNNRLTNKNLTLENGGKCSAMDCCDPIDHDWSHDDEDDTE